MSTVAPLPSGWAVRGLQPSESLAPILVGARVQRIDLPEGDVLSLGLGPPVRATLVAALGAELRTIGLVHRRPKGAPANAFVQLLRKHLEGRTIRWVGESGGAIVLGLSESLALVAEAWGQRGRVVFLEGSIVRGMQGDRPPDGDYHPGTTGELRVAESRAALERAGTDLLAALQDRRLSRERRELLRSLSRLEKKLRNRRRAIAGDLARGAEIDGLRQTADLILAHLHTFDADASAVTVTDWMLDPPEQRTVAIDPKLGPKTHADRLYRRARKLERGSTLALERLDLTTREQARVEALIERVKGAAEDTIAELRVAAERLGIRQQIAPARRKELKRLPYRSFRGTGDRTILVGRGAADNDRLTLQVARGRDLWLHVRGQHGAHVVVPLNKGEACPAPVLIDAATLAVHFSEAAGEAVVEVQYSPRRFIRKPKGFAPGAVAVDREKVLALRTEPPRLRRLLGSEVRSS
ncbi:MAG: NFACT RNA binding domain-containing protein [Myxococcota bacterium]